MRRYYLRTPNPHLYIVFAVITVLGAIVLIFSRSRRSQSRAPDSPSAPRLLDKKDRPSHRFRETLRLKDHEEGAAKLSPVSTDENRRLRVSLGPRRGHRPSPKVWPGRPPPINVASVQINPVDILPEMDGDAGELGEDPRFPSASETSRAVSTTPDPGRAYGAYPCRPGAVSVIGRTGPGCSPGSISRGPSVKRHSDSSDGISTATQEEKGENLIAGTGGRADGFQTAPPVGRFETPSTRSGNSRSQTHQNAPCFDLDFTTPRQFVRPPLPPPLTPPAPLGTAESPFEDRCPSYAVSIAPELDRSFIHQPNPEYAGSSTSADVLSSNPQNRTAIPRRRSYTKSIPIGIPLPTRTTSDPSSTTTVASARSDTFFPESYPPTSPLLPPPPPLSGEQARAASFIPPSAPPEYQFVGGPGGPGVLLSQQEIDLQGEIISVVDDAGHGWKRHTRVYGGGVCLACAAARGRDGEPGGFYGDKVPLEDRR